MPSFKLGNRSTVVGSQAKYGPTADLGSTQQQKLTDHYGKHSSESGKTTQDPLNRLTQYDSKHSTYVNAAEQTGRPLTEQERVAKRSGGNAPLSSINHVIASGTGQNIMNHETLRFGDGAQRVNDNYQAAVKTPQSNPSATQLAQAEVRKGLAQQAASVGRVQGYSRGILNERQGETGVNVTQKRGEMMQKTLTAFQGKDSAQRPTGATPEARFGAYKDVLKQTFDSPGNLRVGNSSANTKVSTGFDAPLDAQGKPTPRAERLHNVHQTYASDRLLTNDRLFTKDKDGNVMSSSKQVDPNAVAMDTSAPDATVLVNGKRKSDNGTSTNKKQKAA